MEKKDFYELVYSMRKAQKEYFKTRSTAVLQQSKALERQVDAEIEREQRQSVEPKLF